MGLFRNKPAPPHAGDAQLLQVLATRSGPLERPRHWVHYLYAADEPSARSAAAVIADAGWGIQRTDPAAEGPGWLVVAERHDACLSEGSVREARGFFEAIAMSTAGGMYDGWEASG